MKRGAGIFVGLAAWLLIAVPSWAGQVAVLVHGYLGDAASWKRAGVVQALIQDGWRRAGVWQATPEGVRLDTDRQGAPATGNAVYLVELPSTAPLAVQAGYLGGMLEGVARRHPGTPIQLVGHSAGGVVARLALVNYGPGAVSRLVTIASPHLGTERAWQALEATDDSGLFGPLKRWFVQRKTGDSLYRTVQGSRSALLDLAPPVPGSLLHWLNTQEHPDIEYVSIVRGGAFGMADRVVPAPSQDMNLVPALRGRAQTLVVASDHLLGPGDARLLMRLLGTTTATSDNP